MAKYRPFGDAPVQLAQEVRASPPSPAQANLPPPGASAQQLARKMPVRAAPRSPPREVNRGTFQKVPIQMILQAGGMNGAPIQASNINGAPIVVDPLNRPGSLAAVNMDTSVSAQVRASKKLGALRADGVQVSGDYTDAIRNAAGFAFGPPRLPKQGFAAASYSYPAKQMVVGATLAGKPIVNPMPSRGASPSAAPKLVTRGGIRGQISSSPSEERRRLLSTLQGLAGSPDFTWVGEGVKSTDDYGKGPWSDSIKNFLDELPNMVPPVLKGAATSIVAEINNQSTQFGFPVPFYWTVIANNIGATEVKCIKLPDYLKAAYLRWAYKYTWKADISDANLKRALQNPQTSAQNLAATVAHPSYDPSYKSTVDRTDAEVSAFLTKIRESYKKVHGCYPTDKRLGEWRTWVYTTEASQFYDRSKAEGTDFLVKTWPDTPENTASRAFCAAAGTTSTQTQTQVQTGTFRPTVSTSPIITKPPTQNTLVSQILKNTAASGQVSLPPQQSSTLPVLTPPALPAVPKPPPTAVLPAAPASNTMLIVGGVVALAAVAFVATRK